MEQNAKFEGYAVVEIMGHQMAVGMVTTEAFGSVVMFRIVTPEVPETEMVTTADCRINYELIPAGSTISIKRDRAECYVGAASVYRMTPIREDELMCHAPLVKTVKIKAVQQPLITQAMDDEVPFTPMAKAAMYDDQFVEVDDDKEPF